MCIITHPGAPCVRSSSQWSLKPCTPRLPVGETHVHPFAFMFHLLVTCPVLHDAVRATVNCARRVRCTSAPQDDVQYNSKPSRGLTSPRKKARNLRLQPSQRQLSHNTFIRSSQLRFPHLPYPSQCLQAAGGVKLQPRYGKADAAGHPTMQNKGRVERLRQNCVVLWMSSLLTPCLHS